MNDNVAVSKGLFLLASIRHSRLRRTGLRYVEFCVGVKNKSLLHCRRTESQAQVDLP
jgi:hypothetical protein